MGKNGGARPGAGRKKGVKLRPQLRDYFTQEEIDAVIAQAKKRYVENDKVLVHIVEQIFGKPQQFIEHSGDINLTDEEAKAKANKAVGQILGSGDIK